MCTGGQPVSAARALQAGILDAVIDGDLLEGAIAFAQVRALASERRRTRDLQDKISDRAAGVAACQAVRATVGKAARGARAPFAAVDAVEACFTMDFDAGSRREVELFADCVLSTESQAMRHLFFAEREAGKVPDVPINTPTRTIIARIMTALANEGARVLEEGYATRAGDIDVVYVHGFGCPRHRGGPMFYADTVGLATVVARVRRYREQFGDYWQPAALLERMAIEGRTFHGDAA
jgi:hypothetical protein